MVSVCIGPGAEVVFEVAWLDVWLAAVETASVFEGDDRVLLTADPEPEAVAEAALEDDTAEASRL